MALACFYDERVEFVEMAFKRGGGVGGKGGGGERLKVCVAGAARRQKLVARDDAAEVFVDDEYGMAKSVEQNSVGGFFADSGKDEELFPSHAGGFSSQRIKRTSIIPVEERDECLDGSSFADHVSRRANEGAEVLFVGGADACDGEDALFAEIDDGALDATPGSILRQIRAEDDLKRTVGWPPLLMTVGPEQDVIETAKARGRGLQ